MVLSINRCNDYLGPDKNRKTRLYVKRRKNYCSTYCSLTCTSQHGILVQDHKINMIAAMQVVLIFSALLLVSHVELYPDDLSNLGSRISDQVHKNLEHLNNLNADINESVQRQLQPLQNLGSQISSSVTQGLAPLNNLGSQIQNNVYQALEPVRALEVIAKMQQGIGGTTIVTYKPGGKQLVAKNSQLYECEKGEISPQGQCSGTLAIFQVRSDHDFCFLRQQRSSVINNQICIGADSISVINDQISCKSSSGRPVLLMGVKEFQDMCKDAWESIEYKYIGDVNDPARIQIPNANKYVKCKNNEGNVCVFDGTDIEGSTVNINSFSVRY